MTDVLIHGVRYNSIACSSNNEPMLISRAVKTHNGFREQKSGQRDLRSGSISVDNHPVQKVSCVSVDHAVVLLSMARKHRLL